MFWSWKFFIWISIWKLNMKMMNLVPLKTGLKKLSKTWKYLRKIQKTFYFSIFYATYYALQDKKRIFIFVKIEVNLLKFLSEIFWEARGKEGKFTPRLEPFDWQARCHVINEKNLKCMSLEKSFVTLSKKFHKMKMSIKEIFWPVLRSVSVVSTL